MEWTRDGSGRLRRRPHYLDNELEQMCENAICSFLRERHGRVAFPVSTADLTVLIALIHRVMGEFQVSLDAAGVRIEQRKVIVRNPVAGLFG